MPVNIGDVLWGGYRRTMARNGLLFVGVFYLLSLLDGLFSTESTGQPFPSDQMGVPEVAPVAAEGAQPFAPSLGLSPIVAGVLSLVLAIVSIVVTIAALRTFVSDETEQIPAEFFTRNVVWATLNLVVGGIIFGVALAIGFLLLVIPGLFLLVSLFFWQVFVATEDQNFVEGFQESWRLTRGDRLRLFGLGVVFVLVALVVGVVFGIPGLFLPDVAGFLVAQLGSAFVTVFYVATVAQTFNQLRATESAATETADATPV